LRNALALLFVCLGAGACAPEAADSGAAEGAAQTTGTGAARLDGVPVVLDTGRVRIVSDDPSVTRDLAEGYAADLVAAYDFDETRLAWTHPVPLTQMPITFGVLSPATMTAWFPGDAGATLDPTHFAMSAVVVAAPRAYGIEVHELSHVQSARAGGGLPHFLEEGKAQSLQLAALQSRGIPDPSPHREILSGVTADVVAESLQRFRFGPMQRSTLGPDETIGGFFVEFLRTRTGPDGAERPAGAGTFPDAFHRIARTLEEIVAEGGNSGPPEAREQALEAAFQRVFGVSLATVVASCVALIEGTADDPAARLAGTIYAPQ
jgi:hypothetical protein